MNVGTASSIDYGIVIDIKKCEGHKYIRLFENLFIDCTLYIMSCFLVHSTLEILQNRNYLGSLTLIVFIGNEIDTFSYKHLHFNDKAKLQLGQVLKNIIGVPKTKLRYQVSLLMNTYQSWRACCGFPYK